MLLNVFFCLISILIELMLQLFPEEIYIYANGKLQEKIIADT